MARIATSDGTRLFYKDWGPKDAQALMFHHGWPPSADEDLSRSLARPLRHASRSQPLGLDSRTGS